MDYMPDGPPWYTKFPTLERSIGLKLGPVGTSWSRFSGSIPYQSMGVTYGGSALQHAVDMTPKVPKAIGNALLTALTGADITKNGFSMSGGMGLPALGGKQPDQPSPDENQGPQALMGIPQEPDPGFLGSVDFAKWLKSQQPVHAEHW